MNKWNSHCYGIGQMEWLSTTRHRYSSLSLLFLHDLILELFLNESCRMIHTSYALLEHVFHLGFQFFNKEFWRIIWRIIVKKVFFISNNCFDQNFGCVHLFLLPQNRIRKENCTKKNIQAIFEVEGGRNELKIDIFDSIHKFGLWKNVTVKNESSHIDIGVYPPEQDTNKWKKLAYANIKSEEVPSRKSYRGM